MTPEEMKQHARHMAELFPPNKTVNECECCQRHSVELQAVFQWRGAYHTVETAITNVIGTAMIFALRHHVLHSLLSSKHIDFSTTHSFCDSCFAQIKRRKLVSKLVKQFCLMLIVLAALILASIVVCAVVFVFPQPSKTMLIQALIGLCLGIICLIEGLVAEDHIVRWCLPETMRFISKPPFELVKFQPLNPLPAK